MTPMLLALSLAMVLVGECYGDCRLPDSGVCTQEFCRRPQQTVQLFCPHLCGLCGTATTTAPAGQSTTVIQNITASTTYSPVLTGCSDKLTDHGCSLLVPNFCSDKYAEEICPLSCGFCCENRVHTSTCEELAGEFSDLCTDHMGVEACARFCGRCPTS